MSILSLTFVFRNVKKLNFALGFVFPVVLHVFFFQFYYTMDLLVGISVVFQGRDQIVLFFLKVSGFTIQVALVTSRPAASCYWNARRHNRFTDFAAPCLTKTA